jgi:hypothetical protein
MRRAERVIGRILSFGGKFAGFGRGGLAGFGLGQGGAQPGGKHPDVGFQNHGVMIARHFDHLDLRRDGCPFIVGKTYSRWLLTQLPPVTFQRLSSGGRYRITRPRPSVQRVDADGMAEGSLDRGVVEGRNRRIRLARGDGAARAFPFDAPSGPFGKEARAALAQFGSLIIARSARLSGLGTGIGVSRRTTSATSSPEARNWRPISHAVRPPPEKPPSR